MSQGKASVQLVGNLGKDPEVRFSQAGLAVCKFSVAVTEKRKDTETTSWIDCTVFDKRGEAFAKFHKKGARVILFGRLQQETWTTKDTNEKRSKLSVIVDDWLFAGGERSSSQASEPSAANPHTVSAGEADDTPF